jgi:large subunit ribosomal protein L20
MARVKRSVTARSKHKKLLQKTKGYRHTRKNVYRVAKQAAMKAEKYAYKSRKLKKRSFRRLWIIRINAACSKMGIKYSRFIKLLSDQKIPVNRKELAQMAQEDPKKLEELVKKASVKSAQ